MNTSTLETLVRKMRAAQKLYFRESTQSALAEAKKYERMVDVELDRIVRESDKLPVQQDALGLFFNKE